MDAKRSFRKSQLIAFDNVAAGHDGVLSDPSGLIVAKPCKQSEIDFYESASSHPDSLPFIPTFLGTVTLGNDAVLAQAAGALVLPNETALDTPAGSGISNTAIIANDWAPSNGAKIQTDLAIVLENVAHGYKKPNILDVKLGARLWDNDAPVAKRARLDQVAAETTSKPLGFRIAGMKTYQGLPTNSNGDITTDGYKLYDKKYGRSFTVDNIVDGFREYFLLDKDLKPKGPIRKVIRRFVADLKEMQQAIEKEESRMYSASLLFVYEGDQESLQTGFLDERDRIQALQEGDVADNGKTNGGHDGMNGDTDSDELEHEHNNLPAIQSLKLIDFAHASWTPGNGSDQNLLHGIRNVISTMSELL